MRRVVACLILLTSLIFVRQTTAQDAIAVPDVTIRIEGLACPICAYGLEKRLKRIDTVEAVSIHIRDGEVRMKLKEGATIEEGQIREAVSEAGFTLSGITYREEKAESSRRRR